MGYVSCLEDAIDRRNDNADNMRGDALKDARKPLSPQVRLPYRIRNRMQRRRYNEYRRRKLANANLGW